MLRSTFESAPQRNPRFSRIGGFVISPETAAAWASRLTGKELHPEYDYPSIWQSIFEKIRPYRIKFEDVGEVAGVDLMIITQSARFKGYKDMDPALIPQFKEGEREAIARKLLDEEGAWQCGMTGDSNESLTGVLGIRGYKFRTVLA